MPMLMIVEPMFAQDHSYHQLFRQLPRYGPEDAQLDEPLSVNLLVTAAGLRTDGHRAHIELTVTSYSYRPACATLPAVQLCLHGRVTEVLDGDTLLREAIADEPFGSCRLSFTVIERGIILFDTSEEESKQRLTDANDFSK